MKRGCAAAAISGAALKPPAQDAVIWICDPSIVSLSLQEDRFCGLQFRAALATQC